jgi:nitroimidazol reductase NimA-like FMN-containing flavoprotein (pyridoxamine 5'-phosphate oxidase superfamily)
LQVDNIESDFRWKSVLAFGNFEEIKSQDARREVLGKFLKRFPMLTPVESQIADDAAPPPVIVFRICIDRITGVEES